MGPSAHKTVQSKRVELADLQDLTPAQLLLSKDITTRQDPCYYTYFQRLLVVQIT